MLLIENPSRLEVRAVIRFLMQRKITNKIHKDVLEVYGENVISRKQVSVWCKELTEGRTSLLAAQEDQQMRACYQ
jgi:hypothetical protein